jgi:hypothetical protein
VANLRSPFASSATAQRLPPIPVGQDARLTIRLSDTTDGDKILILVDPNEDVSAARADAFLNDGESIDISGAALGSGKASDISIIRASGTGMVYFGVF